MKHHALALLAVLACGASAKPMVPMEESCRKAQAIVVVEVAGGAGALRVLDTLYDGPGYGMKKGAEVVVDLKGMTYDPGRDYILFLEQAGEAKAYRAVPQARTEDSKPTRERVREVLRGLGKIK